MAESAAHWRRDSNFDKLSIKYSWKACKMEESRIGVALPALHVWRRFFCSPISPSLLEGDIAIAPSEGKLRNKDLWTRLWRFEEQRSSDPPLAVRSSSNICTPRCHYHILYFIRTVQYTVPWMTPTALYVLLPITVHRHGTSVSHLPTLGIVRYWANQAINTLQLETSVCFSTVGDGVQHSVTTIQIINRGIGSAPASSRRIKSAANQQTYRSGFCSHYVPQRQSQTNILLHRPGACLFPRHATDPPHLHNFGMIGYLRTSIFFEARSV